MEDEIIFSVVIEKPDLLWEETAIANLDLRDTEDNLSYKDQAEKYQKDWNMTRQNLVSDEPHLEFMEERIDLMTTIENMDTEDNLSYKDQAEKCKKEWNIAKYKNNILRQELEKLNEAKQNLANAKQHMEFMEQERIYLMTTIENKNKHILEIENKADKSAEDAKAALALYTKANNQIKDVMYQATEKRATMQKEKDDLQEQLQQLKKIMDAEAQDHRNIVDYLNKKMAQVENEKNRNAKTVEFFYSSINECKKQLKDTMMQSEKEKIISQRAITKLQNNLGKLSEELRIYTKSATNSEADKIILHRAIRKLRDNLWNLAEELEESKKRTLDEANKVQEAEQRVMELSKIIDAQTQDEKTDTAKLDKLDKENKDLENQQRSNEHEVELLYNSLETERSQHESAMKRLHVRCTKMETELKKYKDAHFNLLLKLDQVHNYSKISVEESASALFDKTFIEQKLKDERTKEEDLAEETTYIINKFASAKDRHGLIKSLKKRIEKESCPSPADNEIQSDEDSDIEYNTTVRNAYSDIKYWNERLTENNTTTNCHNKREKNTNVFNINMNIADSKVSFIDKAEEQMLSLNGGSRDHKAIEGKEKL
ncbi:MYH [Mytilus coruscus]|uniref:MYH n=1 Tax=Mytilus coruscus TaxID=42192 RepID=A0A6J8E7J3_MYTCO|nr:MYH [Mytilus coruscus]